MAKYSYFVRQKWIDTRAKNINEVRAEIIKQFGPQLQTEKIANIWIAKNDVMVGCVSFSKAYKRFEYGDDHVAYGEVNAQTGRLTYDD